MSKQTSNLIFSIVCGAILTILVILSLPLLTVLLAPFLMPVLGFFAVMVVLISVFYPFSLIAALGYFIFAIYLTTKQTTRWLGIVLLALGIAFGSVMIFTFSQLSQIG